MRVGSLIDDVELDYGTKGPPVCFKNADIRKMLTLAQAKRSDVFLDLGSGWGQSIIVALTEFNVSGAVGLERDPSRYKKSLERRSEWLKQRSDIESERWQIMKGDFDSILSEGNYRNFSLRDSTLIYYGLSTDKSIVRAIQKAWKNSTKNHRIVYYHNCLFPEIVPSKSDFPFFVSYYPFSQPKSEEQWLSMVCRKYWSSLERGKPASKEELWDELRHDLDIDGDKDDIAYYKKRLRYIISKSKRRPQRLHKQIA